VRISYIQSNLHHKLNSILFFLQMILQQVLIIDEISMVKKTDFKAISDTLQKVRNVDAPFGGIQVILTGDFFQLPPVGKYDFESADVWRPHPPLYDATSPVEGGRSSWIQRLDKSPFVFASSVWYALLERGMKTVRLNMSHRHADPAFVELLDKV
jgi:hypothetical protein